MANDKKPTWKDVKLILLEKEKNELLKLVADLYSLNTENKSFINSRYSIGENNLEPYKNIISESLYPAVNKPIKLSVGKKAISDYFKSTEDILGKLELMVHYLEMGNQFTVDYGDIDDQFYSSLESMFEKILDELRKQPKDLQNEYFSRLENVVSSAGGIGWGYYDYIKDIFDDYEIELNDT